MLRALPLRGQVPGLFALVSLALLAAAIILLPTSTTLLLIGGVFLFIALLRWHALVFYLLAFAIPFGSLFPLPLAGPNITAADLLLGLAAALWLARQVVRRRMSFRHASLTIPFIVFILAASISITGALSLQASAKELVKWLEMLAAYWLIVQSEFTGRQVLQLLVAIFLAGLAEALVGVYQYLSGAGPEGFLLFGGSSLRAFGTFEQPNPFAGYLGLVIPLALGTAIGILVTWRSARPEWGLGTASRAGLFVLAIVSLGVMLAALFFSLSRGAWLSVASALAVTTLIRSRRAALWGVGLAALIAVLALLGQMNLIPDIVTARFAGVSDYIGFQDVRGVTVNDANFAIVERMAHWEAALNMFNDHPWFGVGFGNYAAVYPAYALPHWDDPLGHAHNYYLNVLAESGIVGLAGYIFLWGAIFWAAWRAVRSTGGLAQGIAAGAFGVLVALSVHNLFDNLFVHSMQIQVGTTLGLIELTRGHKGVRLG